MAELVVRTAHEDDVGTIVELIEAAAQAGMYEDFTPQGIALFRADMSAEATRQRLRQGYLYLIAESDGHAAGMIAMRDMNHLYNLFTAVEFRRRGVAAALWREALSRCQAANPNLAQVTVSASNYALDMYKKLGFEISGEQVTQNGITYVPMILKLKP